MKQKSISTPLLVLIILSASCLVGILCLFGLGLGGLSLLGGITAREAQASLRVQAGTAAPDFSLETLDGKTASLGEFQGFPVLINFWAVWCSSCQAEMPLLREHYAEHYPDLIVLAVEEGSRAAEVVRAAAEMELDFTVLMDPSYAAGRLYGITAYPISFFVDRAGIVQAVYVGQIPEHSLDENLVLIGLP